MDFVMGDEEKNLLNELDLLAQRWRTATKAIWVLIAGAFGVGGWVASLEFRQQEDDKTREEVVTLKEWKIETAASRWTIQDQSKFSQQIAEQNRLSELRLQRLEDTQTRVLDTLDDIKNSLKRTPVPGTQN